MKFSRLLTRTALPIATILSSGAMAQQEPAEPTNPVEAIATFPAVSITEVRTGSGKEAVDGARIGVHYTGWLLDEKAPRQHGKKFDSSYDRHRPIFLVLGEHRVIAGWEQGLQGMKVGGKRTLLIPSALAYGATGVPGLIPPGAALVFDVELVAVSP